jgi:hypothetical protein
MNDNGDFFKSYLALLTLNWLVFDGFRCKSLTRYGLILVRLSMPFKGVFLSNRGKAHIKKGLQTLWRPSSIALVKILTI